MSVICLLFVAFFSSCSSLSKSNDIFLSESYAFRLKNVESENQNKTFFIKEYEPLLNSDSILQIPLYKVVESVDYKTYIGMLVGADSKSVYNFYVKKFRDNSIFNKQLDEHTYFLNFKKDSLYAAIVVKDMGKNQSYSFCLLSANPDKTTLKGFSEYLNSRIIKK